MKYENEFDEVYTEYFSRVYRFLVLLCKNSTLAEEITQETFFKALRSINQFDGRCDIGTWLCKIAKNTYYDYLKKHKNRVETSLEFIPSQQNIEDIISDKEIALEIHKILHNLKEPYKEVFSLRVFGQLSFEQIGFLFEKPENWARVTYYRAKIMIKEKIK